MTRPLAHTIFASTVVLLACLGTGCGGSDTGTGLTCEPNTFRLVGSIDEMSIDVTQPANGSEFSQIGTGEFLTIGVPDALPSSYTDLHVTWSTPIADGGITDATATLKIPTSPFPDDVFCAGHGSTIHISDKPDGTFYFYLTSLSSGAGCATPRQGALVACSRFAPN